MLEQALNHETSFVRAPQVQRSYCKGGAALWDPESDAYFHLNDTGAEIWEHLSRPATLPALLRKLSRDFDASPEAMEPAVQALLRDFVKNGLVKQG